MLQFDLLGVNYSMKRMLKIGLEVQWQKKIRKIITKVFCRTGNMMENDFPFTNRRIIYLFLMI